MPSGITAGQRDAYFVWQDDAGWHLRTTAKAPDIRHFNGRVWVQEGAVIDPAPLTLEGKDRVHKTARSLEIDFYTQPKLDGIDWKFSGAKCVQFTLLVEGKEQPKLIFLGATKANPPAATFSICP
jgi:hypothetical protein